MCILIPVSGGSSVHLIQHSMQQFIMKAMSTKPALRGTAEELLQHPWITHSCSGDISTVESPLALHQQVPSWGRTQAPPKTAPVQHGISQYKNPGVKSLAPELTTWDGCIQHPSAARHHTLSKVPVKDGLLHGKPSPGKSGGSNQVQISIRHTWSRQPRPSTFS